MAHQIELVSKRLRISKKKVIEEAVLAYARQTAREGDPDVFAQTSGAWKRRESAATAFEPGGKIFCLNTKHFPVPDIPVEEAW